MRRCALCRKTGTERNPINKHHVRGKNYPDVMETHTHTCHWFAQWITNAYLMAGIEAELDERRIIYLYNRVVTLRHGDGLILPVI